MFVPASHVVRHPSTPGLALGLPNYYKIMSPLYQRGGRLHHRRGHPRVAEVVAALEPTPPRAQTRAAHRRPPRGGRTCGLENAILSMIDRSFDVNVAWRSIRVASGGVVAKSITFPAITGTAIPSESKAPATKPPKSSAR